MHFPTQTLRIHFQVSFVFLTTTCVVQPLVKAGRYLSLFFMKVSLFILLGFVVILFIETFLLPVFISLSGLQQVYADKICVLTEVYFLAE